MKQKLPHLLIVCGSGRNVGKTALAETIIRSVAGFKKIAGVKISPHFHDNRDDEIVVWKEEDCVVYNEINVNSKDSSRFLQAGANPVYYIETTDQKLEAGFKKVLDLIQTGYVIVCESGMLARYFEPGVLIFIEHEDPLKNKTTDKLIRNQADIVIPVPDEGLPDVLRRITKKIIVVDGKWKIVKRSYQTG